METPSWTFVLTLKILDYCNTIRFYWGSAVGGQNSCSLSHVSGLIFCLYVVLSLSFYSEYLAILGDLAKVNNNAKSTLVRQNLFLRTIGAQGMRRKDSKGTVRVSFFNRKYKNDSTNRNAGRQRHRICLKNKKVSQNEGIEVYLTMTKTAFASRTILSRENIFLLLHQKKEKKHSKIAVAMKKYSNLGCKKRLFDRLDTEECQYFRLLILSVEQTTTGN